MADHDSSPLSSFDFNDQLGTSENNGGQNIGKSNFRGKRKSKLFSSQMILAGIGFLILAVGAFAGYYAVTQLPTLDPRQQAAEPTGSGTGFCNGTTDNSTCSGQQIGSGCTVNGNGGTCVIDNRVTGPVYPCFCDRCNNTGQVFCGAQGSCGAACRDLTGYSGCQDWLNKNCGGTGGNTPPPNTPPPGTTPTPTPKPSCSVNAVLRVNNSNQAISEPLSLSPGQTRLIRAQVSNVPSNYEISSVNFRSRNENLFTFTPNNPTQDSSAPYEGTLRGITGGSGDFVVNVILKVKSTGQNVGSVTCQDVVVVRTSSPASPTPTPAACNQQCNPLIQNSCISGLTCVPTTTTEPCPEGLSCPQAQQIITSGVCRRSTCSGDTDCVCNTPTPTPTRTPTPTPTRTPTPTPTRTPTPTPTPSNLACNAQCSTDGQCTTGYCYQPPMPSCAPGVSCPQVLPAKVCRNRTNPTSTTCANPTPTPTPTRTPTPTPTRTPTPTPTPVTGLLCNQQCSTDSQCSTGYCYQPPMTSCAPGVNCPQVLPAKVCRNRTNPTSTTCANPTPTPTPTATPAPACNSIAMSNGSNLPLALNQNITFTCGQVAGATGYEFRLKLPDASVQGLAPSATGSRISQPFQLTKSGKFTAQCRACFGNMCQAWEPWPNQ